jgi:hypothetical protein
MDMKDSLFTAHVQSHSQHKKTGTERKGKVWGQLFLPCWGVELSAHQESKVQLGLSGHFESLFVKIGEKKAYFILVVY